MSDEQDRDLKDVLREERSRGRKHRVDIEAERIQRQREEQIRYIRRNGTEEELRALLHSWEIPEEKIEAAVIVFRRVRGL